MKSMLNRSLRPIGQLHRSISSSQKRWGKTKIHDQNNAYFLGIAPGTDKEDPWTSAVYPLVPFFIGLLILGFGQGSKVSIQDWAMQEAIARNKAEAAGEKLRYGVHYSNRRLAYKKSEDGMPQLDNDE